MWFENCFEESKLYVYYLAFCKSLGEHQVNVARHHSSAHRFCHCCVAKIICQGIPILQRSWNKAALRWLHWVYIKIDKNLSWSFSLWEGKNCLLNATGLITSVLDGAVMFYPIWGFLPGFPKAQSVAGLATLKGCWGGGKSIVISVIFFWLRFVLFWSFLKIFFKEFQWWLCLRTRQIQQ